MDRGLGPSYEASEDTVRVREASLNIPQCTDKHVLALKSEVREAKHSICKAFILTICLIIWTAWIIHLTLLRLKNLRRRGT